MRQRAGVGGAILALITSLALPLPATAHPSDFRTLTLDFLFGPRGLEAIDAAAVESEGPGYEPFPSPEFRRRLALGVLQTLHVPVENVRVDADMSERYHEVGFVIRFDEPTLGYGAQLLIDSSALRRLASEARLPRLKMSACGVTDEAAASDDGVLAELQIVASRPGRQPSDRDREACEVWTIDATDKAISVAVRPPDSSAPPRTATAETGPVSAGDLVARSHPPARSHGPAFLPAIAALAVVFVTAAITVCTRRRGVSLKDRH